MIVILGRLGIDPEQVADFEAAAARLTEVTRAEEGCTSYNICRDLDTPGVFHLVEEWESGEALGAHLATPHFTEFQQALGQLTVSSRSVAKYDVSEKTPL